VEVREAATVLGVGAGTPWAEVRQAYRSLIRARHPDHAGGAATAEAVRVIEAYRVLEAARRDPDATPSAGPAPAPGARPPPAPRPWMPTAPAVSITRAADDTLAFAAPADETFLLLLEAAHDIGELTYLDRSVPILEAICRFEGTPALSLVITLQGRNDGTEAFCTVESIEARPGPPAAAVVDVLFDLLQQRQRRATER